MKILNTNFIIWKDRTTGTFRTTMFTNPSNIVDISIDMPDYLACERVYSVLNRRTLRDSMKLNILRSIANTYNITLLKEALNNVNTGSSVDESSEKKKQRRQSIN